RVASTAYGVPPTNPFAGGGGCDEIWAYGLRNPFRFSFDRGDPGTADGKGDLWIGDVGQGNFEEVDYQKASMPAPLNFGWVLREGCDSSAVPPSCCGGSCALPSESCGYPTLTYYDPVLCHS